MRMDQSEADDVVKNNLEGQMQVSSCLIQTFGGNNANIQSYVEMITDNLVFDDPGMLAKTVIFDAMERNIQDGTVLWLINRLIYIVNQNMNV